MVNKRAERCPALSTEKKKVHRVRSFYCSDIENYPDDCNDYIILQFNKANAKIRYKKSEYRYEQIKIPAGMKLKDIMQKYGIKLPTAKLSKVRGYVCQRVKKGEQGGIYKRSTP